MSKPNPDDCALVLIDLQVGALATVSTRSPESVAAAAGALADLGRAHGLPVVVTVGRKPGSAALLIPELADRLRDTQPIERSRVDAFDEPAFAVAVETTKCSTLILAGIALDIGVASAALSARALGYEVYVVAEACATTDALAEATALARLAAAGVQWVGFAALALNLMDDFSGRHAGATLALVQRLGPAHRNAHS